MNWNDNKCNKAKELFESIFFEGPYHLIKNINVIIVFVYMKENIDHRR